MSVRKIILITGPNGSGKGTVAKYLSEKYEAILYRFSNPLHEILAKMHIADTRESLDLLSRTLRASFGQDIMGRGVREFIEQHPDTLIVLDGIRRISTMKTFSDLIDTIVYIDAPMDIRYSRVRARGEKSGEMIITREDFENQDALESNSEVSSFRDMADIIIDNTGTIEELCEQIDIFLTTKN